MSAPFTPVVTADAFAIGAAFRACRFEHTQWPGFVSPVLLVDHCFVRDWCIAPHPHAGLNVVSYVLEESEGALLDRDTLNARVEIAPGDVFWSKTAGGLIHEESPVVDGREVRLAQVFVNLSARLKGDPPQTLHLKRADTPVVDDGAGRRVRVVAGSYGGKTSPLATPEPFTWLDAALTAELEVPVPAGETAAVYVLEGRAVLTAGAAAAAAGENEVVGAQGGAPLRIRPAENGGRCRVLFFARPALDEPIVYEKMMLLANDAAMDDAHRRYHAGAFGQLASSRPLDYRRPEERAAAVAVERRATVRHYDEGWWELALERCRFDYEDGEYAHAYRLAWRDPAGRETPYRGQGFIPYLDYLAKLLATAEAEGWGRLPYRDSF